MSWYTLTSDKLCVVENVSHALHAGRSSQDTIYRDYFSTWCSHVARSSYHSSNPFLVSPLSSTILVSWWYGISSLAEHSAGPPCGSRANLVVLAVDDDNLGLALSFRECRAQASYHSLKPKAAGDTGRHLLSTTKR